MIGENDEREERRRRELYARGRPWLVWRAWSWWKRIAYLVRHGEWRSGEWRHARQPTREEIEALQREYGRVLGEIADAYASRPGQGIITNLTAQ